MTPGWLVTAPATTTLKEANDIIWDNKINSLPLIDEDGHLKYIVFRKDYDSHKEPAGALDANKSYVVGAGINTRDYEACACSGRGRRGRVVHRLLRGLFRVAGPHPEVDSRTMVTPLRWVPAMWSTATVSVSLPEAGADFVKIGIGGGSICITRETKGIGRGQATAVIESCPGRDEYFRETGVYIPICSDGGIVHDYHITLALAMGADFVMLGRYFARFEESPSLKVRINGNTMKEYWGEGSNRARNWQRYDLGGASKLSFEEGVDSYVPYAGPLADGVQTTLYKVKEHHVQLRLQLHSRAAGECQADCGLFHQHRGRRQPRRYAPQWAATTDLAVKKCLRSDPEALFLCFVLLYAILLCLINKYKGAFQYG